MNNEIIVNNNIPLDIYQTWFNKDLPTGMKDCINKLKQDNPEFTFYLFDDNDCKNFIRDNFGIKVYEAFENLIPGAYKADLWRYCILYKKGGIYIDIKFHTNNFNLKQLTDNDYFVKDRDGHWERNKIGIYNGFIISKSKNPIFLNCINDIIKNVNSCNKGLNSLYPTGPGLIGSYFKNTDEFLLQFSKNGWHIQYKDVNILSMYENYRSEQLQYQNTPHYVTLWSQNLIYKNAFSKIKIDRKLLFDIILLKNIKTLVPPNVYQVYLDSILTQKVKNKSKNIQEILPNFGYFLFNLYDCCEFIRKNFDARI